MKKMKDFLHFDSPFGFVFDFLQTQLLQGGSDQMLRSLHLQKDASAYSYISPGAQLKVSGRKLVLRL